MKIVYNLMSINILQRDSLSDSDFRHMDILTGHSLSENELFLYFCMSSHMSVETTEWMSKESG